MKVRDLISIVLGDVMLNQGYYEGKQRMFRYLNKPCSIFDLPEKYLDMEVKFLCTFSEPCLIIDVEDEPGEVASYV